MHVIYTGRPHEFSDAQARRIDARIGKVAKLVDGKGERELRIYFTSQRHLTKAEATLNYRGHAAVGAATESDAFASVLEALEKLEKQVVKQRTKWRDTKRAPELSVKAVTAPAPEPVPSEAPRIKRVPVSSRRKPMTVDEALLLMGKKTLYLPFRDAQTGGVSVLIRQADGSFDLVES
jgi:putative sigma-54 modulation protein